MFVIQVVYNNVSTEYYSAYCGNSPEQYTARVKYAIEQLGNSASRNTRREGNTTIVWNGTNYLALTASVNTTGTLAWCQSAYLLLACALAAVFSLAHLVSIIRRG